MKKGAIRIILGITLLIVQVLSMLGHLEAEGSLLPAVNDAYDLAEVFGFCIFGIIGTILLISGIRASKKVDDAAE